MKSIIESIGLPYALGVWGTPETTSGYERLHEVIASHGGATAETVTFLGNADDFGAFGMLYRVGYGPLADGVWISVNFTKRYGGNLALEFEVSRGFDLRECSYNLDCADDGECTYDDVSDEWSDNACSYCREGSDFCISHGSYHY